MIDPDDQSQEIEEEDEHSEDGAPPQAPIESSQTSAL